MPSFKKRNGQYQIRFHDNSKSPSEKCESLPLDTPKGTLKHIEGKMNAAYYDDWDPWAESWSAYRRRTQMEDHGVVDSGLTITEAIDLFINKMYAWGDIDSEHTEANYRYTLGGFADHLGTPFMVSELSPRHAESWMSSLDVARSTRNAYGSRLSVFYGFLFDRNLVRKTFQYRRKNIDRTGRIKYITEPEKDKILAECEDEHMMDIINLLFYQGYRSGEVFAECRTRSRKGGLRRRHVDLATSRIKVTGKGDKARLTDITPPARDTVIRLYDQTRGPDDPLVRLADTQFTYKLKKIVKRVLGEDYSWVSIHNLRHSCGTYWAGRGVPIATLQKQFGHSDISTTMIYSKITQKQSKSHFEKAYYQDTPITKIGSER